MNEKSISGKHHKDVVTVSKNSNLRDHFASHADEPDVKSSSLEVDGHWVTPPARQQVLYKPFGVPWCGVRNLVVMATGTLVVRLQLTWESKGVNCCNAKGFIAGPVFKLSKLPPSWKLDFFLWHLNLEECLESSQCSFEKGFMLLMKLAVLPLLLKERNKEKSLPVIQYVFSK